MAEAAPPPKNQKAQGSPPAAGLPGQKPLVAPPSRPAAPASPARPAAGAPPAAGAGKGEAAPGKEVPLGDLTPGDLLKRVRRLQLNISATLLNPGAAAGGGTGSLKSMFRTVGGYDVIDRREYLEGDDPRSIDWRATARTGKAVVKVSNMEIESTIWLCLDMSGSSSAGLADVKRNVMVEVCATIALTAAMAEERYGLVMFTDHIEKLVQPQAGKIQFDVVTRELCYFKPKNLETNIPAILNELEKSVRGLGAIFVISDFIGMDLPALVDVIRRLKKKRQEVVAIRVLDPVDFELPEIGLVRVENPESGEWILVDTADPEVRRVYAQAAREADEKVRGEMRALGIPTIDIQTTDSSAEMLRKFFVLRSRARAATRGSG
ncbi:MAG: DUF58 domain-containing protein [Halobacteria archaeon]